MRQLLEAAFGEDRPFVDVYDGDTPKARLLPAPPPALILSLEPQYTGVSSAAAANHIRTTFLCLCINKGGCSSACAEAAAETMRHCCPPLPSSCPDNRAMYRLFC